MKLLITRALLLAALSTPLATPAFAQDYGWSAGWAAGALYSTSLNSGSNGTVDLAPDLTWSLGFHVDKWAESRRVGVQLHTAFSQPTLAWTQGDRGISMYGADLSVLLRPVSPSAGSKMSVFLSAGAGFNRWGLGDGPTTTFPSAEASYDGVTGFNLVGVGGLGIDIDTGKLWGEAPLMLRISARDEVQRSPLDPLTAGDSDFSMVHNLRITIGLHSGGSR